MHRYRNPVRLIIIGALVVCGCFFAPHLMWGQSLTGPDPALQRTFIIVDDGRFHSLDPHTSSMASDAQLFTGLYEGLFSYHPYTLEPVYALAENYKISRDRKKWTFTIRSGATYSDGTPITAEEFRRSWLRLLAPETNAPFASLLDCIVGAKEYRKGQGSADGVAITAKDLTLTVRLTEPCEHLNRILCNAAFSAVPEKSGVYSGPFVLTGISASQVTLTKNFLYWDQQNVHIPGISYRLSDAYDENTFGFNVGDSHWVAGALYMNQVYDTSTIQLSAAFATEYLFFQAQHEPFDDPAVRNAILLATPWDELRESAYYPCDSLVLPLTGYPTVIGVANTDVEEGRDLLIAAGYNPEDITLTYCANDTNYSRMQAEMLKANWEKLGITVVLEYENPYTYYDAVHTGKADMYSYSWIGDFADPMAFLELFRGDSTLNDSGWASAEYDRLLSEGATISSVTERFKVLARAEQLLLDSGEILPIEHSVKVNYVDREEIGGWFDNAMDIHPMKYFYFKQKTSSVPNLVLAR